MKRILLSFIVLFLVFLLVSCDSNLNTDKETGKEEPSIEVVKVAENIGGDKRTIYKIETNNSRGYAIEAYLTVPEKVVHPYIIVTPYKTGKITTYEEKSKNVLEYLKGGYRICRDTEAIGLFPIIPELSNSFRHLELDPETILSNDEYIHMERQVAAIIKDAITYTNEKLNIKVSEQVDMQGYSGEGNFVTRFAIFYPELINCVCAGGTSWTPILPVSTLYGETLKYPLGIADIEKYSGKPFNLDAWKKINFYVDMGLLDDRGCYNKNRLMELDKFKANGIVFNNDLYKEIWEDFSNIYVQNTDRAQMVSYEWEGHVRPQSDYANFLKANTGDAFIPLSDFSSKAYYKTAAGNGSAGSVIGIFVLLNNGIKLTDGWGFGRRNNEFTLTVYVDGVQTSDFTFSQSSPEYGTITKNGATLTLKATELNKVGSEITITTNNPSYTMKLKWHD